MSISAPAEPGSTNNAVAIAAAALGFAATYFFGFMVLIWIGAALATAMLLPRRPGGSEASRWLAGMLVGHALGFAIALALAPRAVVTLGPDLLIGLALALWVALRPGKVAFILVIVFELLALAGNWITFSALPAGSPGTTAILAHVAWRAVIVVVAIVALVRRDDRVVNGPAL